MATYKNYPILQNADTIASVPAYTVSLVDTIAAVLGNADYQTWDTAGSLSGWKWNLTFRKVGRIVVVEVREFKRTTGSTTNWMALFTLPAAFRTTFQLEGPTTQTFAGTSAQFQIMVYPDGTVSARNTAANAYHVPGAFPALWVTAG